MYKELSSQFDYTESEFKETKSRVFLNITCPCCSNIFSLTKHQIQTSWEQSTSKILYCSTECKSKSKVKGKVYVKCKQCNTGFDKNLYEFKKYKNHFCSQSCSATYNNTKRSEESRMKQRESLKKTLELKPKNTKQHILICKICDKEFTCTYSTKVTCSQVCRSKALSMMHIKHPYLIHNRSTSESYLERSFREYIESNGYVKNDNYKQEYGLRLSTGKRYIADFYFPTLGIIIELDGKQHQDTIEEDAIRDNLILEEFKIQTYRVTWKEWNKKTKMELINKLLGIND